MTSPLRRKRRPARNHRTFPSCPFGFLETAKGPFVSIGDLDIMRFRNHLWIWCFLGSVSHAQFVDVPPVPITPPGGAGSSTVDLNVLPTLEDPNYNQSRRATEPLGDANELLLYSGEFLHEQVDFELPGRAGSAVEWRRTYRSRLVHDGPLGFGWTHSYHDILKDGTLAIQRVGPSGELEVFNLFFGVFRSGYQELSREPDGSFLLLSPTGEKRTYSVPNSSGISRLTSIQDRRGSTILLTYDSQERLSTITDTFGRTTTLSHYATNRIKDVTDPSGRTWTYRYNHDGTLRSVTVPDINFGSGPAGDFVFYEYLSFASNKKIQQLIFPEGVRFQNTYLPDGTLETHQRGPGSWSFSYQTIGSSRLAHVTDRNGNIRHYTFGDGLFNSGYLYSVVEDMNRGINPNSPPSYTTQFDFEPALNGAGTYSTTAYPDGRIQYNLFDKNNPSRSSRGNVRERRTNPSDGSTPQRKWFIYETRFNQVKISVSAEAFPTNSVPLTGGSYPELDIDDPSISPFVTEHIFDYEEVLHDIDYNGDGTLGPEHGNIVKTIFPKVDAHATRAEKRYLYNSAGQRIEMVDSRGYRTRNFYWPATDPFGLNTQSVPVSSSSVPGGLLAKVVVDYSEDPATIDPNTGAPHRNLTTTTRYDSRGNLISRTDPRGNETTYAFNGWNKQVHETSPAPFYYVTQQVYDNNGQVIERLHQNIDENGVSNSENPWIQEFFTYNGIGKLTELKRELAEGVYETTRFIHDKNENVVLTMSPAATSGIDTSNVTSSVFDERDLLYSQTEGGFTAQFAALSAHDHIDLNSIGVTTTANPSTAHHTYHSSTELIHYSNPEQEITETTLDGLARPKEITHPDGGKTVIGYDLMDRQTLIQAFDASDRLLSEESTTYDRRGKKLSTKAPYFRWDNNTMVPITTDGDGDGEIETTILRDLAGNDVGQVNDRGLTTQRFLDGTGQVYREVDPSGNTTTQTFDGNNNAVTTTRVEIKPSGTKTLVYSASFDEQNRKVTTTAPDGQVTTLNYDSSGRLTSTVDPLGNVVSSQFDDRRKLVEQMTEMRDGGTGNGALLDTITDQWLHHPNGHLSQFIDGENRTITVEHDSQNREKSWKQGSAPATTAVLSDGDTVDTLTLPNGTVVQLVHDSNDRLQSETVVTLGTGVDGLVTSVQYSFDELERLVFADNGVCQLDREYDSRGNLIKETVTDSSGSYTTEATYNGMLGLQSLAYPSGLLISRNPHATNNFVDEIQVNGSTYFDHEYVGRRILSRLATPPGGVNVKLRQMFDAANRLFLQIHDRPSVPGMDIVFAHMRNGVGLKTATSRQTQNLGDQFFYDSRYQLQKVREDVASSSLSDPMAPALSEHSYDYDKAKNRTEVDVDGSVTSFTANDRNQIDTINGSAIHYDNNGNMIDDGTFEYVYDFRNRLRKVMTGSTLVVEFQYDPLGRRFRKITPSTDERELWFGQQLLEIHRTENSSTSIQELIWGKDFEDLALLRVDGVDYFLFRDDQQSTTHVVDATGTLIESYDYDPFGSPTISDSNGVTIPLSQVHNPSLYTGRRWDSECDLYYYRTRYYSPSLGRFLTTDTIGLEGGTNLYAYTENNPVNGRDPFGTTIWKDFLDRADPTGKLTRRMNVLKGEAKSWPFSNFSVGLGKGGPSVRSGIDIFGDELAKITEEIINTHFQLIDKAAQFVIAFMNEISFKIDGLLGQIGQLIESGAEPGSYTFEIAGEEVKYEHHANGLVAGEAKYDNGTCALVTANGGLTAKVPAGTAGCDMVTRNPLTGTITYVTADKFVFVRYSDGRTVMKLKNGNTFVYDKNGKLIKHCKPGEECRAADEDYDGLPSVAGQDPPTEDE